MTTTVASHDLDQQVQELNKQIAAKKTEAAQKKNEADALVADYREKGVNPLTDQDAFGKVDAAYKLSDELAQQVAEMEHTRTRAADWQGEKDKASTTRQGARLVSLAETFMQSESYQAHKKAGLFESGNGRVEIQGIEALSRDQLVGRLNATRMMAATLDAEPIIAPQQSFFPPVPIPVRQIRLLDLLTVTTTDSNLIQYVAMTARDDNAEATAKGDAYNEANYEFEPREAPVRDIGQWIPAHRSELADQGQLQALLERLLSFGVELALEEEILTGDGTGQHLTGILETDDINSVSRNGTNAERRVEVLHRAITATRLTLYGEPDGMVLHPTDYEETLFEKTGADGLGGYVWIGALAGLQGGTPQSLWGKPVVTTPVMPNGTGLVGNFKAGGTVYMRAGVTTRASDSHADFFIRRMVAILAETRAAFAVPLPVAFCEVTNL